MGKKIYKYVGSNYLDKVIESRNHVTLKCSYPKDFNDPYELFLTIDPKEHPKVLAFYSDVVGNLPQLPTTCFSRSPSVIPMWAHYAQNLEGFAIEFDEMMLAKFFSKSGFGDVDYQDAPNHMYQEVLYRAFEIGKARYLYMLQSGIFSAGYYTKASYWSYEQERRMVVDASEIRTHDGLMLMDIPKKCVKALICGPRMSPEKASAIRIKARQLQCNYFEMKIGRNSVTPFFVDSKGNSLIFKHTGIRQTTKCCKSCKEPLDSRSKQCSWCKIKDAHKKDAAERNIFRAMDHFGLLDEYYESMNKITRNIR